MLRRDPFWQMATRAGARTAVVRFSFTYPARGEASYIVSDRAGSDKEQWRQARLCFHGSG
jgi:hypothetical protein